MTIKHGVRAGLRLPPATVPCCMLCMTEITYSAVLCCAVFWMHCSISVTFVDKEGKDHTVAATVGKNLLEVAHDNEIDLEGGCCSWCAGWTGSLPAWFLMDQINPMLIWKDLTLHFRSV